MPLNPKPDWWGTLTEEEKPLMEACQKLVENGEAEWE